MPNSTNNCIQTTLKRGRIIRCGTPSAVELDCFRAVKFTSVSVLRFGAGDKSNKKEEVRASILQSTLSEQ
jgi:hypothetical protein